MCSSKKGISSNQLARVLEITVKSAWFLSHRIRHAMTSSSFSEMGGPNQPVEVDETFYGNLKGVPKGRGVAHKNVILTMVERGGRARSFHVESTSIAQVMPIVCENLSLETTMMTDEASQYKNAGKLVKEHHSVNHSKDEYVRDGYIHTNTVEGYYSIFKRGMKGIYQHCAEHHLHRYLAEFDFRYSNRIRLGCDDSERAIRALLGVQGKRLTYRRT